MHLLSVAVSAHTSVMHCVVQNLYIMTIITKLIDLINFELTKKNC